MLVIQVKNNNEFNIVSATTRVGYTEDYSKVFKWIIKTFFPDKVFVQCDRRYYNGELFESLGFTVKECISPDYKFVKNYKSISRKAYYKNPSKYKGYYKVYDCGRCILKYTK